MEEQNPQITIRNLGLGRKDSDMGLGQRHGKADFIAPLIILEVVVVTVVPSHFPSWFKLKTVGTGFTPATWQGWLVTIGPVLLVLAIVGLISYRQRQK